MNDQLTQAIAIYTAARNGGPGLTTDELATLRALLAKLPL